MVPPSRTAARLGKRAARERSKAPQAGKPLRAVGSHDPGFRQTDVAHNTIQRFDGQGAKILREGGHGLFRAFAGLDRLPARALRRDQRGSCHGLSSFRASISRS